jgi:predicted dehydrogenase
MTAVMQPSVERGASRIGLIGAGGIGRAHAQAVGALDGARLAAVADVDDAAAKTVADAHDSVAAPVGELADPQRFDLVVVASPPSTHPDVVGPLLEAGVPVLCEKPLAVDRATSARLADLAETTGTPLTMATKFRFVDDVLEARRMIRTGELGEILKVEVAFAGRVDMTRRWNADPAVAGGGVLIDNATHAVDLVRFLVGDVVEALAVNGPSAQPLRVEDSSTLLARTAGGTLAQIDVTWSFRRLSPTYCAVYGTAGSVEIGWAGGTAVLEGGPAPVVLGTGYNKIKSLRDNLAAVLRALAEGTPLPVKPADAVAAAAVIDAGYRSVASGSWTSVEASA